jgi:HAD superfamily hydrolase (TIGR01459 family)
LTPIEPQGYAPPPAAEGSAMRRVAGLRELTGEYHALLCDVWGVLHNGVAAFADAVDAISRFRETTGPVVLITNAPRPFPSIQEQLRRLGVPDAAYDRAVTSGDVTRAVIAERPGVSLFHLGPDRDLPFYEALDVVFVSGEKAEIICCTGLIDDTRETPENYRTLFARLVERRTPMVCANPDIVVERGNTLVYCAGALARLYAELGGETILAGKPHRPIYDVAKRSIAELGGQNALAVGDGLPTDIRGAVDNDLPVLFVTGGIHAADFGPPTEPDGDRVAARLKAEGLRAVAYVPTLVWDGGGRSP